MFCDLCHGPRDRLPESKQLVDIVKCQSWPFVRFKSICYNSNDITNICLSKSNGMSECVTVASDMLTNGPTWSSLAV